MAQLSTRCLRSVLRLWSRPTALRTTAAYPYIWNIAPTTTSSSRQCDQQRSITMTSALLKKGRNDKVKKSNSKHKVSLNSEELNAVFDYNKMIQQMELAVDSLRNQYAEQLSLRTSAGLFDSLPVETTDGKFPLIQIAQIQQKSGQLIVINMSASPQYIQDVKKALDDSGLNLNAQQDGTTFFVPLPKVTRELREKMAKSAKTLSDNTKVKLRDLSNRFTKDIKKAKAAHSEDILRETQVAVQSKMHEYSSKVEEIMTLKQKDLLINK